MALTIQEPLKTVNGLITKAIAAETQLLYTITTDIDISSVTNYRIEVEVRDAADTFSLFDNVFIYIPNQAGSLDLDVGAIVTSYLKTTSGFSFEYFLRVLEAWDGSTESSVDTTILQAVLAKKQLLSVGGANMWENLLRTGVADANPPLSAWYSDHGVANWRPFTWNGEFWNCNGINDTDWSDRFLYNQVMQVGTYEFTIEYSAGNVAGDATMNVLFMGENSAQSTHVFTADGVRNTITFSVTAATAFAFYGFQVRPTIAQGTSLSFNIFSISINEGGEVGKLLTKFKNPVMWRGWNRTSSYLLDQEYTNRTGFTVTRFGYRNTDINKVPIDTEASTANFDMTPRVVINKIPVEEGEYIRITIVGLTSTDVISEEIFYRVQEECQFPIMLDWISTDGGIDQWLFSQYTTRVISDSGIVAETPITTDIEFITRTKRRFANSFRQQITLRAEHLTGDQLRALQEIKQTESLRVYLSKDGVNYIDAIVVTTFTTEASTRNNLYSYVVVIEFPDGFIFSDGKLY